VKGGRVKVESNTLLEIYREGGRVSESTKKQSRRNVIRTTGYDMMFFEGRMDGLVRLLININAGPRHIDEVSKPMHEMNGTGCQAGRWATLAVNHF
jgi:hypothetical protein